MLLRKQPLREQLCLELFIRRMKIAQTFRLNGGDIELIGSVPRMDGDAPGADHRHAVFRAETQPRSVGAEHDAPDRRARILEREIMMSRGIDLIIGKLAADINAAQRAVAFYNGAYVLRDLRYGERRKSPSFFRRRSVLRRCRVFRGLRLRRLFLHGLAARAHEAAEDAVDKADGLRLIVPLWPTRRPR